MTRATIRRAFAMKRITTSPNQRTAARFAGSDIRVSTVSSNGHDCHGVFPCQGINYGNQQGDYEGLVSYGGVSHPIWTDSRRQLDPATGCRRPYLMEEVFTAS